MVLAEDPGQVGGVNSHLSRQAGERRVLWRARVEELLGGGKPGGRVLSPGGVRVRSGYEGEQSERQPFGGEAPGPVSKGELGREPPSNCRRAPVAVGVQFEEATR